MNSNIKQFIHNLCKISFSFVINYVSNVLAAGTDHSFGIVMFVLVTSMGLNDLSFNSIG